MEQFYKEHGKIIWTIIITFGLVGIMAMFMAKDGKMNKSIMMTVNKACNKMIDTVTALSGWEEKVYTYKNIEELKKDTTLTSGMKVQTEGYYDNKGAGTYTITDETLTENGGTVIALENGLFARLLVENDTIDVTQFGAYADGIHNDSEAIQNALNSGTPVVTFAQGDYKCCNVIKMTTDNVKIVGNDSILFTDNDYQTTYYEWFFNIVADNIEIDELNFEARETITPKRKSQVGIMYANNVTIKNCEFNIPNTVLSEAPDKNCEYTNLDIYTCWNNITVTNCVFYDMADCLAGGNLEIRDIKGYDCNGCTFTNNICYANNHDEIIGVFCLSSTNRISDVIIKGNSFHQENTTMYGRSVGLSLGYSQTYGSGANNITFEKNFYEGYSHFEFIKFGRSENVTVKDNTLISHFDDLETTDLCLFRCGDAKDVKFEGNTINVKKDGDKQLTAIARGNVAFNKNKITSNVKFKDTLFSGTSKFTNNTLTFKESFGKLIILASQDGAQIENNKVITNNWGTNILAFCKLENINATKDINVNNNTLQIHNKSTVSYVLSFSGLTLNENLIHCNNNVVIDEEETTATAAYLLKGKLKSEDIGKIETIDNSTGKLNKVDIAEE